MTTRDENLHFKGRNIIDIDPSQLDTPIYRVFPKERLIQTMQASRNTLVKPRLWDDPFENFILKSVAAANTGMRIHFDTIRENFYGQCWTFNTDETDALWRIYSHAKDGFRVRTTIRKLFDQFYDADHR
jgi:hypothetical protein